MRNVELTKQRLFGAATAEFAQCGLAGARIDRIAEQAGVNKALIYAYFGNKETLFETAIGAIISQIVDEIPIDAADLPGYAVRRFDWQREHPDAMRIMEWARMERVDTDRVPEIVAAGEAKRARVAQAQRDGLITDHFTAAEILSMIDALAMIRVPAGADDEEIARRRQVLMDAVRLLVAP
jgi:AcrR family transcriptional regulator